MNKCDTQRILRERNKERESKMQINERNKEMKIAKLFHLCVCVCVCMYAL